MGFQNILVENDGAIQTIAINRPKFLNALNKETIAELGTAFDKANKNEMVRAIIITGSGEKAFVAGADIKEFADFGEKEGRALSAEGQKTLFDKVELMNKPVIAAINGFALGGGLELALCSHIRLASENARLGLPEVTLGIIPGYGGTQRLAQLVGKGKALEMITSARMVSAQEALQCGLVNHVVEQENLLAEAKKLATKISKNAPLAVSAAIRAILAGYEKGVNGYEIEISEFGNCFSTEDFKEGTKAFLDKRKPEFVGK